VRWRPLTYFLSLFIVLSISVALRVPKLTQRPMHTDEAVHAIKFGQLLEKGFYHYDPFEYHGPTLNYFTFIPAWISKAKNLTDVTETTLRIVPVFFGLLLVILPFFIADALGKSVAVIAALLTAVSPAMSFYSRYYIQEPLLIGFAFATIVFGYRYFKTKKIVWAIMTGICAGLFYATKETWIIIAGSMLLSLFLTGWISSRTGKNNFKFLSALNPRHVSVFIVSALGIGWLFYSSFFTYPKGVIESFATFITYFHRAGENAVHIHPWYYFIKMLLYSHFDNGPVWSEAFIALFSGIGFYAVVKNRVPSIIDLPFARFIAFYTLFTTVIYSAIPYKTPWLALGFLHGMILLAALGIVALFQSTRHKTSRLIIVTILAIGSLHLLHQSSLANFKYDADPVNPYVYAHTSRDIFKIVDRVTEVSRAHPDGKNMYIEVICPENDYWPLPWYLRVFPHVGWWNHVDFNTPPAPLILAFPSVEEELIKKLYELPPPGQKNLYLPLFDSYVELRPNVEIRGYVTKNLWEREQLLQADAQVEQLMEKKVKR